MTLDWPNGSHSMENEDSEDKSLVLQQVSDSKLQPTDKHNYIYVDVT